MHTELHCSEVGACHGKRGTVQSLQTCMYVPAGQNEADGEEEWGRGTMEGGTGERAEESRREERKGKESWRICRVRKTGRVVFGHSLHTQNQDSRM